MKKIDFSCRKVSLKDLIQCNFNLNESEYQIFSRIMVSKKGMSVKDLVERVEKDRTTVQKILVKLLNRGLLTKRQINLDRGFMFVYFSKNKSDMISDIEKNIEIYFKNLKESLDKWKKQ
jgi:predicted transcriptional regulator